jgi:hypothetical protein
LKEDLPRKQKSALSPCRREYRESEREVPVLFSISDFILLPLFTMRVKNPCLKEVA